MNFCFVGIGSIALRHIRNIKELYGSNSTITALRSGTGRALAESEKALIDRIIFAYNEMESYDAIFITNPTALHYESLKHVIDKSNAFFIEKPVFMSGNEDYDIFDDSGKVFYVACPLRYSNVIHYVKQNIDLSKVYSARSICSSFLPEWRACVDYRSSYSASKEKGSGVSIDLIHEWDYLTYLFGYPRQTKSIVAKKSDLEIHADDIAVYIAEYDDYIVELHLDYFGRKNQRMLELFTKDDTINCDLLTQKIVFERLGRIMDLSQVRDDYQKREIQHFVSIMERKIRSDNDLHQACNTLRLARGYT